MLHTMRFDHSLPSTFLAPPPPSSSPIPANFKSTYFYITYGVQFVLPIYLWVLDHPLKHDQPIRSHAIN